MVKNGVYNGTETSGQQESVFSWTDNSVADISLQARVHINGPINASDQRVGILVHYPGSGLYKWALVLHNRPNNGGTYLELLDESREWLGTNSTQPSAAASCPIMGVWYTFNMTVHGFQAWGWAQPDGSAPCPNNVTVATVTPHITTTGFSNSFIQNGGPNANIHGAVAGTAELQNGTGSAPVETYNSYNSWGGLSQAKNLYNSTGGIQWLTSSMTYDSHGNPASLQDARGGYTYYGYSSKYQYAYLTNKTQVSTPGSTRITSLYSYNFTMGTLLSSVDPKGNNSTYQYDILDRPTRTNYPTGDYVSYKYNDIANYVNVTNENGWKTQQTYDGIGRLKTVARFSSGLPYSSESYSYNWLNEVSSRGDALGNRYTYQYDALGRVTMTTKPDGNSTRLVYNDVQAWTQSIDENGSTKYYLYDRLGRLIYVLEVTSCGVCWYQTAYSYDEVGNLRQVKSASFQITTYTYDNLNRLTQAIYRDVTHESFSYDSNGNMVSKTNRNGVRTSYTYDSLNRIANITYYGSIVTKDGYVYDKNGNLQSLSSQNATLTYSYDTRNRLIYEDYNVNSGQLDYSFSYTFNGEVVSSVWHPLGFTLSYSYDDLGRVKSVSQSGSSNPYARLTYYKNDGVRGIAYGNGLVSNYTYTTIGQALRISLNDTSVSPVRSLMVLNYAYNKTGTVVGITGQTTTTSGTSLALSEKYNYDNLQRLKYANVTGGTTKNVVTYGYDSLGNRAFQTLNGTSTSYTYNTPNNELKSSTTTNGPSLAYSYDPDGNLLTQNVTTGGSTVHWTYAWDVPGNLLKASKENAVQGSYAYDGLGRRVMSREGTTTGYYAYSGTETRYEYFNPGGTNYYVYAGGERIARVTSYGAVNYYHADALGSTRLVTSSTKSVLFSDNYQPFGQDNLASGSETYRFTGASYSSATGLYYEVLRWYDSSVGRFISLDPLSGYSSDSQSLNGYVYVRNTPTTLVDPTGAVWCDEDPIACEGGLSPYNSLSNADREDPRWIRVCSQNPPFCGGWTPEENDLSSLNVGGRYTEDAGWSGDTPASGDVASAGDATPHPPAITATASDTLSTLDTNPTDISSDTSASIEVKYISRAGFDEAQSEGAFGNQPTSLAQGNYAHNVLGSGQAPRALGPGSFPDQWDTNGFTEIKPYHEGIEPLQEFSSQLGQYRQAFQERFGYAPSVRLILYRYV